MTSNIRISQEDAAARIGAHRGYELVSVYQRRNLAAVIRCPKHNHEQAAYPKAIWNGGMLACCNRDALSSRMKAAMAGSGNSFYGRSHSAESRERMSRTKVAAPHSFRGKPRPGFLSEALSAKIKGVPRPASVRAKVRDGVIKRHDVFGYCLRKMANGKTAGSEGIFYVVRLGDGTLKIGSTTKTMAYRLTRLRQKHGPDVTPMLHCVVPDAGAYEAAMMERHREHWIRGEQFRNWLSV